MASIEIHGLRELSAACAGFGATLQRELQRAQADARRRLVGRLTQEPPPRPGQRYVRTGQQSRGWQRAIPILEGGGATMRLINPIAHDQYTQGDDQAWMHAGRWTTASAIADAETPAITADVAAAAQRAADTINH